MGALTRTHTDNGRSKLETEPAGIPLGVGSHRRLAEPALGAVALCPLLPGPLGRHPPPLKRTLKRGRGLLCPVEVGTVPRLPPVHRRRRSVLCRLVLHRPPHARHQASQICRRLLTRQRPLHGRLLDPPRSRRPRQAHLLDRATPVHGRLLWLALPHPLLCARQTLVLCDPHLWRSAMRRPRLLLCVLLPRRLPDPVVRLEDGIARRRIAAPGMSG